MAATPAESNGCTWLYLINGGEKSFEEEKVAREELKKIYNCFVSKQLVKPEHVVCVSGGCSRLFQHDTVTNVSKMTLIFPQKVFQIQQRAKFNKRPCPNEDDRVVVVFIGHGSDPDDASQMPPSNDKNAGRLVFLNQVVSGGLGQKEVTGVTKKYDDLSDFWLKAKKTLFICQACYSGNVIEKATKRISNPAQDKHMLAISTGPDHPASYDGILADVITDFFSKMDWKEKSFLDFHQYIQDKYYDFPYYKRMFKENIDQTEEEYEEERIETVEWAVGEFEMLQPRKIPNELWGLFREVEKLKSNIDSDQDKEKQLAHIRHMEQYRFDLMRMYKHKPNYKMNMYGSVDVMGKMKMGDFFHTS
ncbi:uncharacterized protein [Dysidea avara]|uniref:uncharacterized protein isoform X2 n=1 Tax=Dysidea avara TaxID=196820 RepID=UPI00331A1D63